MRNEFSWKRVLFILSAIILIPLNIATSIMFAIGVVAAGAGTGNSGKFSLIGSLLSIFGRPQPGTLGEIFSITIWVFILVIPLLISMSLIYLLFTNKKIFLIVGILNAILGNPLFFINYFIILSLLHII